MFRPLKHGGSAFPSTVEYTSQGLPSGIVHSGMSLRAWLAGMSMAGLRQGGLVSSHEKLAEYAVADADALLAKLGEG